ncbi:hypothetical protein ACUOA8_36015, partial [Escherichia sp. SS-MK2]
GVIVERGTHNDLLEHRGVYAQLHKMQQLLGDESIVFSGVIIYLIEIK